MAKITTFRCYVSQEKREAFMSLVSPITAGIWLKLCDRASNASSWKLTGTLSDLAGMVPCSESDFQTFLNECKEHELVEIWTNGDRINLVSGALTAAMERRDRQRAQARARMKRYRGKGQGKKAANEPGITDDGLMRNSRDVTHHTVQDQEESDSNLTPEPECADRKRFTVHEDDNVVVVVVVSYKNKQQLQPPAPGGDSSVEAGPSTPPVPPANPASPSNGIPTTASPVQMPFVPFPGVTLPPMQLVMGGILPDMPKPQVIVDNTKSPLEKGIDELINLLPASLRTPECRSMIEKLHADKGFGYLKAQIKYVLDMEYQGEKGFRGYLRKAVRKNFAEYREPVQCAPAGPAKSSSEEESRRINDRRIQQAAADTLERMKDNPSMKDQLRALERAALDRFPKCDKTGFLPMAMRQIIVECLERQAGINHELMIKEGAG